MQIAYKKRTPYHTVRKEENEQVKLTNYVRDNYPQAIIVGDALGLITNPNMRNAAMKTRSERGIPDIMIFYPSRGYHGLVIELKAEGTVLKNKDGSWRKQSYDNSYVKNGKRFIRKGDHIAEQVATLEKFIRLGYYGRFAVGFLKAKRVVDWYFNYEKGNNSQMF